MPRGTSFECSEHEANAVQSRHAGLLLPPVQLQQMRTVPNLDVKPTVSKGLSPKVDRG